MIEGHGDDVFRYEGRVKYNFSSNIHQNADHSRLHRHLSALGYIFKNYPEPTAATVQSLIASSIGVAEDNVIVTNGATEIIYLIAQQFHGGKSCVVVPTFREYQDACRVHGHDISFISSTDMLPESCDIVWICNPNNPDGKVFDAESLKKLIDGNPETLFVIDQAYADYSVKEVISTAWALSRRNVVLLYSLTKRFAVPGLRIGYALGCHDILDELQKIRMPWSVNSVAIEAAKFLLENENDYPIDAHYLHSEALRISDAFRSMVIETTSTDCNFLLARLPHSSASELKNWLINHYGILIRDASNFESLDERYFRVAAQTEKENDILIEAMSKWMSL